MSAKKAKARKKPAPRAKKPAPRQVGLIDAIGEAYSMIEELAGEMREWESNMEEKFSQTAKYDTVSTTAETLENIQDPCNLNDDEIKALNAFEVTIQDPTPTRRGRSRSSRAGDASYIMQLVIDKMQDEDVDFGDHEDTVETIRGEIEDHQADLDGCEFPGMFG